MATKKFHKVIIVSSGKEGKFTSVNQAHKFLVDNNVAMRETTGFKQSSDITRLTMLGRIRYEEVYEEVGSSGASAAEIRSLVKKEVEARLKDSVLRIDITKNNKVVHSVEGIHHHKFKSILKVISSRTHIMMAGPCGSGKSTLAHKAADVLSIPYYSISVGAQTSKVEFMGYMNAEGNYVTTHFRNAYENGGVFLIDEIDAGNPGVLTVVNAALANGVCAFPDAMVKRHEDFVCCAAANTWGKGADRMYVGRNQLDAATLDRFAKIPIEYDEILEHSLATNKEWCRLVQRIRKVVFDKKLRVIVSPRATFTGSTLLQQGFNFYEVLEMTLLDGGLSTEEIDIIMSSAGITKQELTSKTEKPEMQEA